jgi:hypothetical protein
MALNKNLTDKANTSLVSLYGCLIIRASLPLKHRVLKNDALLPGTKHFTMNGKGIDTAFNPDTTK